MLHIGPPSFLSSLIVITMTKELDAIWDELKLEIISDLKDFKDSLDRCLCKELHEMKNGLCFVIHLYGETKKQVRAVHTENKFLREETSKL